MLHLMPLSEWRTAGAWIRPVSLEQEGFIHCTDDADTLLAVANRFYQDVAGDFVVLVIDPGKVTAEIRHEAPDPAPPPGVIGEVLFPHVYGPLETQAVLTVLYARRGLDGTFMSFEARPPIAEAHDLLPHPEGGWFRRIWTSTHRFSSENGERATASAILFFLADAEISRPHTVASDEMWILHGPGDLELQIGESSERLRPLAMGGPVQAIVPAGNRQSARAYGDVLVTCVVSPEFDFADFRMV